VILALAFIRDQLVFFMFPDKLFYIERSGAEHEAPAVAAVLVVVSVVFDVKARPRQGKSHR
jgi:hypothetical protein